MNAKAQIAKELDDLVLHIAEAYNDLIADEISDKEFEEAVKKVTSIRDKTADNLLQLVNDVVEATIKVVVENEKPTTKEERLAKLLPEPLVPQAPEVVEPPPTPVKPTLLGPPSPLPREVGQVSSSSSIPPQLMEDEDIDIGTHNLGLTIEQEKRLKAGKPINPLRPTISVDHQGVRETHPNRAPTPTLPIPEPAPKIEPKSMPVEKAEIKPLTPTEKNALYLIQDIMVPYREDKDRTLATVACSVLSVISKALSKEGAIERYSGVEMLWKALTAAIQKLRKLEKDVKFEGDVLRLREVVSSAVEDIVATVASYPLPDEAPTEKPVVPLSEVEEEKDGT